MSDDTVSAILQGGPEDGRILTGKALAAVHDTAEGEIAYFCSPKEKNKRRQHGYRRLGGKFVYVRTATMLPFRGGPLAGSAYPMELLPVPWAYDDVMVVPQADGTPVHYRITTEALIFMPEPSPE